MNTCLDLRGKYGKMSGERDRESRQPHVMLEASTGGLTTHVNGGREMASHILPQNDSDSQENPSYVKVILRDVAILVDDCDKDLLEFPLDLTNGYASYVTRYPVTKKRFHRAIMERMIDRALERHEEVDHINGDRGDNRRFNLRIATRSQNAKNRKPNNKNKTGFKGVTKNPKYNVWYATICANNVKKKLGSFRSPEAAYDAYCHAAIELHGEFASQDVKEYIKGLAK